MIYITEDTNISDDIRSRYLNQISQWNNTSAIHYGNKIIDSISSISNKCHSIFACKDNILIAAGIYVILDSDDRENLLMRRCILISMLAGNRNGGGKAIVDYLKKISIRLNIPISVCSDPYAATFYSKMGFVQEFDTGYYIFMKYCE